MEKVLAFLRECGVFYLATTDNDQPCVRPFGAVSSYQGKIYLYTMRSKNVAKQMNANPKIQIAGMAKDSWIRVTGKVALDEAEGAKQAMMDQNPFVAQMAASVGDDFAVYAIMDGQASIQPPKGDAELISF